MAGILDAILQRAPGLIAQGLEAKRVRGQMDEQRDMQRAGMVRQQQQDEETRQREIQRDAIQRALLESQIGSNRALERQRLTPRPEPVVRDPVADDFAKYTAQQEYDRKNRIGKFAPRVGRPVPPDPNAPPATNKYITPAMISDIMEEESGELNDVGEPTRKFPTYEAALGEARRRYKVQFPGPINSPVIRATSGGSWGRPKPGAGQGDRPDEPEPEHTPETRWDELVDGGMDPDEATAQVKREFNLP